MYGLKEQKQELRRDLLQKRESIAYEAKEKMDNRILSLFTSLISYRYSDTLLLYYPTKGEVDTRPLIQTALKAGKRVALPVCHETGSVMDYYFIHSDNDLEAGKYGIPAPKKSCEKFVKDDEHKGMIIVVPALAFDKEGYRLGYGKGYYDRYVNELSATSIGLVYSDFIMDKLPRGRFDISVDLLVSEKGVKLIEKHK